MKLSLIAFLLALNLVFSAVRGQEIGLQLNSLQTQFEADAPATMAKIKEMGIRQVQMKGTHGLTFPEFIKLLAVNSMTVVSFEADFDKLEKFPQVVADEARSYGAKYIVCSSNAAQRNELTKERADRTALALNHAGKVISRNGLLLCYQPRAEEFNAYETGTFFDYMVEKLDSRFVHFEIDVFSVKQAGLDPVSIMRKYPTRIILVELKDGKAGVVSSSASANLVLGSGDVGIKRVIETARELGIQHLFIEDQSARAEKQIPKSIAYLRTLNDKDSAKK